MNETDNNLSKEKTMKKRKRKITTKSQCFVASPAWLRKRMLKGLLLATHSRVSRDRAQSASETLTSKGFRVIRVTLS
jgi:hypothetical protein